MGAGQGIRKLVGQSDVDAMELKLEGIALRQAVLTYEIEKLSRQLGDDPSAANQIADIEFSVEQLESRMDQGLTSLENSIDRTSTFTLGVLALSGGLLGVVVAAALAVALSALKGSKQPDMSHSKGREPRRERNPHADQPSVEVKPVTPTEEAVE